MRKPKKFKIPFLWMVGAAMAVAVTVCIYLSTGVIQMQPNLFSSK